MGDIKAELGMNFYVYDLILNTAQNLKLPQNNHLKKKKREFKIKVIIENRYVKM